MATSKGQKKASGSGSSSTIPEFLAEFGVDPKMVQSMVDNWKGQLTSKLTTGIEEADLKAAYEKARELAGGSAEKVKAYTKSNPAMFYSGMAALLVGAGLLAAAAKEPSSKTKKSTGQATRKTGSTAFSSSRKTKK